MLGGVICTVDIDVLTLAVVHKLQILELWLSFGTGEKFRFLPAHEYAMALGMQDPKLSQYSMHSQEVIQSPFFVIMTA